MRFIKVFVFLAFLGSPVWAQEKQPLTVLSENPINISQTFTRKLKVGFRNEGDQALTLSFKFSAAPDATGTTQTLEARNERYLSIDVPEQVKKANAPGILTITAQPDDSKDTEIVVERELEATTFSFQLAMIGVPLLALIVAFAAWRIARPPNASMFERWFQGTPELDFTKSFGSLSTLLLAASNAGILSALTGIPDSSTRGLQIMAVLFTAPLVLAPMIVKLSAEPFSETEEKTPVWANLLGVFLVLFGLFAQTYLMHLWLTETGGVFVALGLNLILPVFLAVIITLNGFLTLTKKISTLILSADGTPVMPSPTETVAGTVMTRPILNTLY